MVFPTQTCNFMSVRLDETNYPTWVFQMQHHLRGHGLLKFVDGSHPCPPQFLVADDGSLKNNSVAREKWMEEDSFVISVIIITLSPDALTLVVGCLTSMEVWLTLKQRYASTSELHIMKLKSTLQSIQKGSDCIEKYLLKFKSARDQLASVGVTISDHDVKGLILAGLPIEYGPTRQIIRGKNDIGMEEVRSLLLSAEYEIELKHNALSLSSLAAMIAQNSLANSSQSMQYGIPSTGTSSPMDHINDMQNGYYNSILHVLNGAANPSLGVSQSAFMMNNAQAPQNGFKPTSFTGMNQMSVNNPHQSTYGFMAQNGAAYAHLTTGTSRPSQPPSPKQLRSEVASSTSSVAAHAYEVKTIGYSNGSVINPNAVSYHGALQEDLLSMGKRYQSSNKGKVEHGGSNEEFDSNSFPESRNYVVGPGVGVAGRENGHLVSHSGVGTAFCPSPQNSLYSAAPTLYCEAKQSFTNTEVNECTSSIEKSAETESEFTNSCELIESRKTSMYRGSTGSDVSDKSSSRSLNNNMYQPHKANAGSWEAIQVVQDHDGMLGLNHFKLLNSKHNTQGVGLSHLKNKKVDLSATKSKQNIGSCSSDGSEEKENSDLNKDAAENKAFIPAYSIPSKWQPAILKEIDTLFIQGAWQLPCTSVERPLLNCRQAYRPMQLWQLPLIPPG
ncbi:uncharacterized protein LOC112197330 isoform X1 [Rosa chinensis]|uniref:uncharacterized protein LOC112197330 isoform X1 n=1 Tax=Rosa chinensis TaxID=74649 RepID=UPI001AD90881|nr:uncharacterized protein LOC112197330 isoform X1 [Rosa chinensis]